jgi:hypothetical protein
LRKRRNTAAAGQSQNARARLTRGNWKGARCERGGSRRLKTALAINRRAAFQIEFALQYRKFENCPLS